MCMCYVPRAAISRDNVLRIRRASNLRARYTASKTMIQSLLSLLLVIAAAVIAIGAAAAAAHPGDLLLLSSLGNKLLVRRVPCQLS
jgi:hypothetical protein